MHALARQEGPLDQFGPALGQHLDGHVVGNRAVGDDLANEVEVGLAGRREADLDLLVAHPDQQVEHPALARRAHRVDQCLVAVAQVDRAPQRRLVDDPVGPGAVGQPDRLDLVGERTVPADRHRRSALGVPRGLAVIGRAGRFIDGPTGGECVGGVARRFGLKLVTLIAPGDQKGAYIRRLTGASRTPATGSRSGSGPVAASEKEHPLHVGYFTAPARLPKDPPAATSSPGRSAPGCRCSRRCSSSRTPGGSRRRSATPHRC